MKASECGMLDEIFTHIDDRTGVQTDWNATRLVAYLEEKKQETVAVPVEEKHATFCMTDRGVEEDRITRLCKSLEAIKKPIVFVILEDDSERSHLLVDGTHRYVLHYRLKVDWISAYMVPFAEVKQFIIEGLSPTNTVDLMKYSGLSILREIFGDENK